MNIVNYFLEFVSDIETPVSTEYITSIIGILVVATFFILFINGINYLWSIFLKLIFTQLGI